MYDTYCLNIKWCLNEGQLFFRVVTFLIHPSNTSSATVFKHLLTTPLWLSDKHDCVHSCCKRLHLTESECYWGCIWQQRTEICGRDDNLSLRACVNHSLALPFGCHFVCVNVSNVCTPSCQLLFNYFALLLQRMCPWTNKISK